MERRIRMTMSMKMAAAVMLAKGTAMMNAQATVQAPAPNVQVATVVPSFPPVNLKNFTAASPSREEVDSFLKAIWGYDENRIWSVAAVLKTQAPGVAKVVVFVGDKRGGKGTTAVFFITPDGKHAIADQVIDFGAKPFAETRRVLQEHADGPAMGAPGKGLLLVEFADLQCARCKDAQETMKNLANDFPQARIVYQSLPVTEIHPLAMRAAEEGVCVRKQKGDAGFFAYLQAAYASQDPLTAATVDATLGAAVTAAGADPKTVAACTVLPETRAAVDASIKLGDSIGVDSTPMLVVNGHPLQMAGIPYETLRKIVAYQAVLDGIEVHLQPSLTTLK